MRTRSLDPRPKTMVIGVGVRLVHMESKRGVAGMVSSHGSEKGSWTPRT